MDQSWLGMLREEPIPSFQDQTLERFIKQVQEQLEDRLRDYLTRNLWLLGFEFKTDEEFLAFVGCRIQRISFEDKPRYYELYLDFIDLENRGVLVGCYSDNIDVSFDGNKVTATCG